MTFYIFELITNKIADIPYGQAFQTDVIAEAMAVEYKVPVQKAKPITNVTLKRLADRGLIERFQKGVYYRAKQTAFGRKNVDDRFIIVRKPVVTVSAGNFRYLQFLDVIRDLPEAHVDTNNPKALLHAFAERNELDIVKTLTYARQHYPQKTLLGLVDVLVSR